jgi:hypothetical protein
MINGAEETSATERDLDAGSADDGGAEVPQPVTGRTALAFLPATDRPQSPRGTRWH